MSNVNRDRIFFYLQGLLKNISWPGFEKVRTFMYRPFFKKLGSSVQIMDGVTFKYPSEICIESPCKIGVGCFFVGLGGLVIKKYALIGSGTKIVTTSHKKDRTDIPIYHQGLVTSPIIIEEDVWFGFNCIITAGSCIGKGSIIAASCVVNGLDIPAYSIVAGVPARIIKSRVDC